MSTGWLSGYRTMVTGGGSGIGRAVVLRYLQEGASVLAFGRDPDKLAEVAESAGVHSGRLLTHSGDVTRSEDLHAAVGRCVTEFGGLDTLVANAGIWDYQRGLARLDGASLSAAFDELFSVNVKGYLLAAEAAWRPLIESRGSIILTLSNASFFPNGGGPLYTASKHACLGLLRQLAYELAPKVRVNGVAPGGMRTDLRGPQTLSLGARSIADSFARAGDAQPPIPLYESSVEPEDFTGPYVLLASAANSGPMTGAVIPIDGGVAVRGFRTPAGGADL